MVGIAAGEYNWVMTFPRTAVGRFAVASALLAAAGVGSVPSAARGADAPPTTRPAVQPPAPWAKLPTDRWPQLVLTNHATFDGHTPMDGASSFLVTMPDDHVYLGTAKHLVKAAGAVDPPVAIGDVDAALTDWAAYPRTEPAKAVHAKGLAETTNHEAGHDWLLLKLTGPAGELPATPLTPRLTPVVVGEAVYLIGVAYTDKRSPQNVYKAKVTARPAEHYFTYAFEPAVEINGFSGAPIVDTNGLLVGHGVSRSKFKPADDGTQAEFGGEDADYLVRLWRRRDDPPGERAVAALSLPLPDGWVAKASRTPGVLKSAALPDPPCRFEFIAEPKTDFDDDVDLAAWAGRVKANAAKNTTVADRQETDLKAGTIGGRPTVEYEVTGTANGVKLRYRIVMLAVGGCYCKLPCWTTADHWDAAQPEFEKVVAALK